MKKRLYHLTVNGIFEYGMNSVWIAARNKYGVISGHGAESIAMNAPTIRGLVRAQLTRELIYDENYILGDIDNDY